MLCNCNTQFISFLGLINLPLLAGFFVSKGVTKKNTYICITKATGRLKN